MTALVDKVWGMKPNRAMSRQLAIREVPSLVHNAVYLEGVEMTLPEIQTLLNGITVGGHKIRDQNMALYQAKAWQHLFLLVSENKFEFSKQTALELHEIAAQDEALAWGCFRTGNVSISGSNYQPPGSNSLDSIWVDTLSEVALTQDIYDKATTAFLRMARAQFFWDVNKRTGRFMMNGILLDAGFPIINLPATRQQEFNQLMLAFYSSADMTGMNQFLRDCINPKLIESFYKSGEHTCAL